MKRFVVTALVLTCAGLVGTARAADDKSKLTGTWKWTATANNNTRDVTLKLKVDGDKITGTMPGRNNTEVKIEDAKFKDGKLTFKVTRERNNVKSVSEYEGKLSGDTIKGKIKTERDGQTTSRDWEAKRSE